MKKLFSKPKSSTWFSGSSQATGSYCNVSSSDAERFACDSWLRQNCLVWHFAVWIKSLNTWQVVFGHSYVCCTTFSSPHWKRFPSLLWASVFPSPVQREKVESPLANMVCKRDHEHTLWLGNLFCNTNKAQVAFLGVSGKTRGCRNRLAPLERVALLLWEAVGGVWSCQSLTSEHLQHVQVALATHMEIQ